MASTILSPLQWPCQNCNKSYTDSPNITFLRGTCSCTVCTSCITNIASLQKQTQLLIEVACPLDGCRRGKFYIEGTIKEDSAMGGTVKSEKKSKQEEVINLESSDEEDSDNKLDIKPAALASKRKVKQEVKVKKEIKVKREVKKEMPRRATTSPSRKNIKFVSPPGPSPKKKKDLKQLFEVGDEVYAAWFDEKEDPKRQNEYSLHPGKVTKVNEIGTSEYGPIRLYNITFDDGDKLSNLGDHYVFSREDTKLLDGKRGLGIGVKVVYDANSEDKWARDVGWYQVDIDGMKQSFSLLSEAWKAYDAHVVHIKGKQTKKSDLNYPDDYHWLFDNKKLPTKSIKREPKKEMKQEEEETDDERFSGGEEYVGVAKSKRRKLKSSDSTDDEEGSYSDSGDDEDSDDDNEVQLVSGFTKQAFMSQPLFHLNSFIDATKKKNEAFGLFIKEGVGTPGFDRVPFDIAQKIDTLGQQELRKELVESHFWEFAGSKSAARQVAMWTKQVKKGSFIIMRHEYPKCKFCPDVLKSNGVYHGPVYVLGMVTHVIPAWSQEEDRMAARLCTDWPMGNICKVEWKWLGKKDDLEKETQDYLGKICQPTVAHICQLKKKKRKDWKEGGTPESVREDLWTNAECVIDPEAFDDAELMDY